MGSNSKLKLRTLLSQSYTGIGSVTCIQRVYKTFDGKGFKYKIKAENTLKPILHGTRKNVMECNNE